MGALSAILRNVAGNGLMFWCPGCDDAHKVNIGDGPGPRWGWNGSADKPTFSPSVLVTYPANPEASDEFKQWRTERRCHSFVVDGNIQFLPDCTHPLAGKTVPLPAFNEEVQT